MTRVQKIVIGLLMGVSTSLFAAPIEFFSSNNKGEIPMATAYNRMIGQEQQQLRDDLVHVMQKNHLEQGRCKDILGVYKMSSTQKITSDNTLMYRMSPYQKYPTAKAFVIAKQLANSLQQESVAVFIPNERGGISKITIAFNTQKPTIQELQNSINEKLPQEYSQAYSVELANEHATYDDLKVAGIQWLGNKTDLNEIQNTFPTAKIHFYHGSAYLIYQDGKTDQI